MSSQPVRYTCLDAWRGLAALAVVAFHCSNAVVSPGSFPGQILLSGWLGVFIFFPVSGYCILAALHSPANRTIRGFLARRWRRILPPYWASVALAVAIGLAALTFNRGSADDFILSPSAWAAVLTLTQVFTSHANAINPVYWSLCYEEQFYLVMALLLLAPARHRASLLTALTACAAIYTSPAWPWRVPGMFLDYWICFSVGCAAYLWLHDGTARAWAGAIFGTAAAAGLATSNVALLVSAATAMLMIALAPYDRSLAATRPVSWLMAVGTFSFSLYLVHVPVGGRVTNLLDRIGVPVYLTIALSCVASLVSAWLFYVTVEKRTLTARAVPQGLTDPAAVAAAA